MEHGFQKPLEGLEREASTTEHTVGLCVAIFSPDQTGRSPGGRAEGEKVRLHFLNNPVKMNYYY